MKKHLKIVVEFLIVMGLITILLNLNLLSAFADALLPISDGAKNVYHQGDLQVPLSTGRGQDMAKDLVLGALTYVKVILAVIGILYVTILGFQLTISSSNEEDVTKARRGIIYLIIGLVMVSMAEDLGYIFDQSQSTILGSPQQILNRVRLFDKQVEIVMTFVKYVIGTFAVIMVVKSAFKLITAGEDEEEVTKNKKSIAYSAGGLSLIYVGEIFVEKVFYKVNKKAYTGITGVHPGVDAKEGVEQLAGITNMIVKFTGPVAVLMLVVGGILYATAAGEEENMDRAKRLIIATIVGMLIIYGAFAIVNTIIYSELKDLGALIDE